MKFFPLFFLFVLFTSCSSGDDMEILNNEMENGENMSIFKKGDFVSDAHITTGNASVNDQKTVLTFTNFMTDDGPKLLVYLSTDKNSTDFVNLGDLKGLSGNYEYNIPSNTDLDKYHVVSIWCVDFLVSFGHADLK